MKTSAKHFVRLMLFVPLTILLFGPQLYFATSAFAKSEVGCSFPE